jgi:sortase (surface protein transpeptidase)
MVPATASEVGWFRGGAAPGQVGSAVLIGHVDSYRGPGVFFELRELRAGAVIEVSLAVGARLKFRVFKVVEYPKSEFPNQLVYGSHGNRELNLVTCGGSFNRAKGSYESNIVVFTRLSSG